MLANLSGKSVLILGGSGYVGSAIANLAIKNQAKVTSVSRRGPGKNYKSSNSNVRWIISDVMQTQKFQRQLQQADIVVHSIGVLFDCTVSGKGKPQEPGSYEWINRQTLIKVVQSCSSQSKKKVIYMSGQGHPPFLERYQIAKSQAEQFLLNSHNVSGTVIKPGFIYSTSKLFTIPLSWAVQLNRLVQPTIQNILPQNTRIKDIAKQFRVAQPISLQEVSRAVLGSALDASCAGKILKNAQIKELCRRL